MGEYLVYLLRGGHDVIPFAKGYDIQLRLG